MDNSKSKRAGNALLGEYSKAIAALQTVIKDIDEETLKEVVDPLTNDSNCRSVQTILTHVVSSGFSYAVYIRQLKNIPGERPEKYLHNTIAAYATALDDMLGYTCATFENITDSELEIFNTSEKIKSTWGQWYDIEQMMEHAIVHVLRHRRQIENMIAAKL